MIPTYLASSEMSIALILSVCPTSFAIRFPDLGSHILITRSGEPDAITLPYGSVVNAYTDAFGPAPSGAFSVMRGSVLCGPVPELEADARSQSLMVRSNEPEANHCCSRLHNVRREAENGRRDSSVREAADVVGMCAYHCRLV